MRVKGCKSVGISDMPLIMLFPFLPFYIDWSINVSTMLFDHIDK